jgi:hypothetical protein
MLFPEKNRMNVHKNQWLLTMPYPLERLARARSRGYTMAPEGQKPSQWLCLTKFPKATYSQPIVHKALSWSTITSPHTYSLKLRYGKVSPYVGFDHGAGHPLLFLDDAKAPNCQKNNGFNDLGDYSEWPKVAGAVIQAHMFSPPNVDPPP